LLIRDFKRIGRRMNMYPFNHKMGQKIQTDVEGVTVDRGFIAHLNWTAEQAIVADTDGIHAARVCPAINVAATCVVKAASAVTDILTITQTVALGALANELKVILTTAADDVLAVTKTDGTKAINIALAKTTAANNAAAAIQVAIRALTTVGGVSVAAVTCAAGGNWDTAAVATGEEGSVYFTGGLSPVDTLATGFTAPPCARNVTATAGGVGGDIKAIRVTVYGKRDGKPINEQLPVFTVNTPGTVVGNLAFDEITSVDIPAHDGLGATTAIGFGDKLGLPYKLAHNTLLTAHTYLNNIVEATEPAVTVSATAIESNTIDLNSALDGHAVDAYFVV
jgi:hypothetical protein